MKGRYATQCRYFAKSVGSRSFSVPFMLLDDRRVDPTNSYSHDILLRALIHLRLLLRVFVKKMIKEKTSNHSFYC